MSDVASLLDTPKKRSLEVQSVTLRTSLKEFEHTFVVENGHKPTRDDIKANHRIAAQYKTYNKIRDVLSGKLEYAELIATAKTPRKHALHKRIDSGVSCTPQRESRYGTPRKQSHPSQIDLYDAPASSSPRPMLFSAIGPTPQRDGRVLGLFDMITSSTRKPHSPSSDTRKRQLDAILEDCPAGTSLQAMMQTPQSKRRRTEEDILQHLTGTPGMTPKTGARNHSRTPVSEGRRFMLSQFFATPSAVRYSRTEEDKQHASTTPLRDSVLLNPTQAGNSQIPAHDATPACLKRSTSFKDRLMSATNLLSSGNTLKSPIPARTGPPTLRHFRAASKPLSQIVQDLRSIEEGDNEDDLDALRELETTEVNILRNGNEATNEEDTNDAAEHMSQNNRVWKKRGQKRTTKQARMRPSRARLAQEPKFVSAEDHNSDDGWEEGFSSDEDHQDLHPADGNLGDSSTMHHEQIIELEKSNFGDKIAKRRKIPGNSGKKGGKINPNAQSHMNFRSLKIRNKNSKASGGGRRFGKRR